MHKSKALGNGITGGSRLEPKMMSAVAMCRFFENAKELSVALDGDYEVEDALFESASTLSKRELKLYGNDKDAAVLVLKKS